MTYFGDLRPAAFLVCGLMLTVGCNGSKKPAAPPVVGNANPAPPAPGVGPVAPGPNKPADLKKPPKSGSTESAEDTEPPTQDDFVLSTDQLVTDIEDPKPKPPPVPFEVTPLAKGLNSSNLVIVGTNPPNNAPAELGNPQFPTAVPQPGNPMISTPPMAPGVVTAPGTPATSDALTLPKGFAAAPGSSNDPDTNMPLRIRGDRDAVDMVLISPGAFLRGADVDDPVVSPRHTVLMEHPYYIDTLEVSVGRYHAFREFYRKSEGKKLDPPVNHDGNPELPAVGIKFFDAKFYAKWTNKELPTESQWERAARGDRGFDFPWGEGRPVFHLPKTVNQLDPVGTFPGDRTPLGVFDMAGNAREWCLDLYQADVYKKEIALGAGTVRDPVGPKSAPGTKQQVVRGGHSDWAVWHRSGLPQNETAPDIGLRCVLNLTPASKSKTEKGPKSDKKSDEKKKNAPKF